MIAFDISEWESDADIGNGNLSYNLNQFYKVSGAVPQVLIVREDQRRRIVKDYIWRQEGDSLKYTTMYGDLVVKVINYKFKF